MFGKVGRHTGGRRIAEGEQTAACFHQQAVGMAVVAAFKFDDFVAAGKTACQTDGGHSGFGTGADEAQPFDGRHDFGDFFGDDDFAFFDEARHAADAAECADGGIHAARDDGFGAVE